jgi:hypothetical protein
MSSKSLRRPGAIALTALISVLAGTMIAGEPASARRAAELPRNTTGPAISGDARVGQTLRVSPGGWSGTQPMTFSYQWFRCSARLSDCAAIRAATNATFALTSVDVGKRLLALVTARNSAGAANARASTETVAPRTSPPTPVSLPTIAGTPMTGQTLTAGPGRWNGTAPVSFAYQWRRCDAAGNSCSAIAGANGSTYLLAGADVQRRLRVSVTARNAAGSSAATSGPTALIVQAPPPGPAGQIRLPSGMTSIPASSVALPERLVVDRVSFSANPVRSRDPFTVTFRVVDTRGFAVRDALVFVRSTPLVTTTPAEQATGQDGTVTVQLVPGPSFRLRDGHNVQFFVRARKAGDNVLAGVSTRRLVQVGTAAPAR